MLYIFTQLLRASLWLFIFACLNYIYPIKILQIIANLLSFILFGFIPHLMAKLRKIQEKMCHYIYTFFYFLFCFTWTFFLFLMEEGSLVWVFLLQSLLFGFFSLLKL